MLIESILIWGISIVDKLVALLLRLLLGVLCTLGYLSSVANVFGYLDSFINLSVISSMIVAILVFDNLEFILRFIGWIVGKIAGELKKRCVHVARMRDWRFLIFRFLLIY